MEKKYSFWERITSDTPTFFKRLQVFGISLSALGVALSQIHEIPDKITTCIISASAAIAAVAQFAVKQYEQQKPILDDEIK